MKPVEASCCFSVWLGTGYLRNADGASLVHCKYNFGPAMNFRCHNLIIERIRWRPRTQLTTDLCC